MRWVVGSAREQIVARFCICFILICQFLYLLAPTGALIVRAFYCIHMLCTVYLILRYMWYWTISDIERYLTLTDIWYWKISYWKIPDIERYLILKDIWYWKISDIDRSMIVKYVWYWKISDIEKSDSERIWYWEISDIERYLVLKEYFCAFWAQEADALGGVGIFWQTICNARSIASRPRWNHIEANLQQIHMNLRLKQSL